MKRRILVIALSLLVLFATGLSQGPRKLPKTIECAVMKVVKVDVAKATKAKMFADYKGRRYFFCCPACPPAFKKNPGKYAKNPSIPTPKG
jgi:YHS domain-containing protein